MSYRLTTGCFAGEVVEEGVQILDVCFDSLDDDLRFRIRYWAESQLGKRYTEINGGSDYASLAGFSPLSMDEIKDDYESSWEAETTEDSVTLRPLSEAV